MSQSLRGGTLTRTIQIQSRSTTKDSFGGQSMTWTTIKTVYALIEGLTGTERLAAQSFATDVSHKVTVRYDAIFADPKQVATYRILYGTRIFNIQAALNVDEANRVVELLASEGLNNG